MSYVHAMNRMAAKMVMLHWQAEELGWTDEEIGRMTNGPDFWRKFEAYMKDQESRKAMYR